MFKPRVSGEPEKLAAEIQRAETQRAETQRAVTQRAAIVKEELTFAKAMADCGIWLADEHEYDIDEVDENDLDSYQ
jgi:hypothetical protein